MNLTDYNHKDFSRSIYGYICFMNMEKTYLNYMAGKGVTFLIKKSQDFLVFDGWQN